MKHVFGATRDSINMKTLCYMTLNKLSRHLEGNNKIKIRTFEFIKFISKILFCANLFLINTEHGLYSISKYIKNIKIRNVKVVV